MALFPGHANSISLNLASTPQRRQFRQVCRRHLHPSLASSPLTPIDAVPIVRHDTLAKFPPLRAALAALAGKISAADMRHMNAEVDADQHDPAAVVRAFRASKNL